MNSELEALLIVQQDDERIRAIEARRDSLSPRLAALDKTKQRVADEATRNESALERELERLHALEARMVEHRQRHEKNVAVLDHAHKLKEATAALAQVEAARKVLAEEESELLGITRRITDFRTAATLSRDAIGTLALEQADARAAHAAERGSIDNEIVDATVHRERSAHGVERALLARYDRVQSRRKGAAVFALGADYSCGSCDTAIPRNRRPSMASGVVIETCEGCGALLYVDVARPTA